MAKDLIQLEERFLYNWLRDKTRRDLVACKEGWHILESRRLKIVEEQNEQIHGIRELLLSWPQVEKVYNDLGGVVVFDLRDGWDCPNSPIDTCVYDDRNDKDHNHCLFCGKPQKIDLPGKSKRIAEEDVVITSLKQDSSRLMDTLDGIGCSGFSFQASNCDGGYIIIKPITKQG